MDVYYLGNTGPPNGDKLPIYNCCTNDSKRGEDAMLCKGHIGRHQGGLGDRGSRENMGKSLHFGFHGEEQPGLGLASLDNFSGSGP